LKAPETCCTPKKGILTGTESALGIRLGMALSGAGLLGVARIYRALAPTQIEVAAVAEVLAAFMVGVPVFYLALVGLAKGGRSYVAEQLVSLAVLAAMSQGDFVTATLVPLFLLLGHVFEERSIIGARRAIAGLADLTAAKATLIDGEENREVPADTLKPGYRILVRPGDAFPADGVVERGNSAVDQSPVTGESVPKDVGVGDEVFAGSINLSGALHVKVTRVGEETALGRVTKLLEEASLSKPPVVQMMQKYASLYLPAVLSLSVGVLLLTRGLDRAISVLVISCPCAFVLAGPAAIVAAMAVASRHGILIKGARFLERMAEADSIVLDKTGTVTLGHLVVSRLSPSDGVSGETLLRAAATGSSGSKHPVSLAIMEAAAERGIKPGAPLEIIEFPGQGLEARTDGETLKVGRRTWLEESGVPVEDDASLNHSGSVTWIAQGERLLGAVLLSDRPRPEVEQALSELRTMGIGQISMVTGDRKEVAESLAQSLDLNDVKWELLPEDKLTYVRKEREKGHTVMVVGDGVNDALALAAGDIGVAMGAAGCQIAIESSDVALMHNDLRALPTAVDLSRNTRGTINWNVAIGAGYSVFMLFLAAAGIINPVAAAALHNLGSVFVIVNSARLLRFSSRHS